MRCCIRAIGNIYGPHQVTLKQKEAELNIVYPYSKSYGKTSISTILGGADGGRSLVSVPFCKILHGTLTSSQLPSDWTHAEGRRLG